MFLILLLPVLLCKASVIDDGTYDYGLTFLAHSNNQDQRTTLDLTPGQYLSLPDEGFTVGFDIKLRNELYTYGYVARIISNDLSSFDIISYLLYSKFNIVLTEKNKVVKNTDITDSIQVIADKWIHMDIKFTKHDIHITADDIHAEINHSFDDFKNIKICFGSNKHPRFFSTDVPPMTIRNVTIADHQGELLRSWKLSAHNRNEVFDCVKNDKALVRNGIWEIDKHTKWSKMNSLTIKNSNPQLAYDDVSGRIFVASEDQLFVYNVSDNSLDSISFKGHPYIGSSSQMIYDSRRNRLIAYSPDIAGLNVYDFTKNRWSADTSTKITTRQHHNRLIDQKREQLIVFGGYDNHKYNSQLSRISLENPDQWSTVSLDSSVYPRYLSAMGKENEDNVLIMGGYGNQSGKQEESPGNFYDLYRLNLNSGKCTKLWDFVNDRDHFTFGNSMIVDTVSNSVYALTYNNDRYNTFVYLSRFEIDTKAPFQQIMSDSITYNFLDIRSYCDLFLHRATSSIYAVVIQEQAGGMSKVEFSKLAFPPLPKEDLLSQKVESDLSSGAIGFILFIAFFLGGAGVCLLLKKRKKKKGHAVNPIETLAPEPEVFPIDEIKNQKTSAILLIGGFQVFDKQGNNITGDFTPTLKQLFLFLLLKSIRDGKGTTSQCLDETFWFDMSKPSASNNRNVNIRKLRLIIEKIGDISITNKNGYWNLSLGKDVTCDYKEVMRLLRQVKSGATIIDKNCINQIVSLAIAGSLLPNVNVEWIDEYKSEYYVLITEILLLAVNHAGIREDHRLQLKISDVILAIDHIDEDAIQTKCKVLYRMGQKGLSKQCFDKFCSEYERLLNAKPDFTYDNIVNSL